MSIRVYPWFSWFFQAICFLKMQNDIRQAKEALRRQIRAALKKIPPAARASASAQVCALLKEWDIWRNAASVLLFAPMPVELDIWPLLAEALAAGKTVALPRFNPSGKNFVAGRVQNLPSDIVSGAFGIREPGPNCPELPFNQFALILVPGLAFDWRGRRLGRGKGFYDRFLAEVRGVKCGVAFDEQIVSEVPAEPGDVQLDCVLAPSRWIVSA
jgi:5-formyltetrahydrofolate cyclo-ligase